MIDVLAYPHVERAWPLGDGDLTLMFTIGGRAVPHRHDLVYPAESCPHPRRDGFTILVATDGALATAERPDLILMDLRMSLGRTCPTRTLYGGPKGL